MIFSQFLFRFFFLGKIDHESALSSSNNIPIEREFIVHAKGPAKSVCMASRKLADTPCLLWAIIFSHSLLSIRSHWKCVYARAFLLLNLFCKLSDERAKETEDKWIQKHISSPPFECVYSLTDVYVDCVWGGSERMTSTTRALDINKHFFGENIEDFCARFVLIFIVFVFLFA